MLVRIFFGDQLKDVFLDNQTAFSVGSGKNTTMPFEDSDLAKNHAAISYTPSGWEIVCNGAVYLRGTAVTHEKLQFGCVYILSERYRISMLCLDDSSSRVLTVPLSDGMEITIGRAKESTIHIDDPLVSRRHAAIRKRGNDFVLQDLGSVNGTYLNNKRTDECSLSYGDSILVGSIKITFQTTVLEICSYGCRISVKQEITSEVPTGKTTKFVRSPRLRRDIPIDGIEIEAPPSVSNKPEFNLVSILLPAIGTVSISVVMALVMNNTRMMLYTLPMTLIGLLVSYLNYRKQKNTYSEQVNVRLDKYTAHLDEATRIIRQKQGEQMQAMILSDPDTKACFAKARTVDRTLWERRPTDADFLSVRVGSGTVASSFKIAIPKEGLSLEDDELRQRPKEIYKQYCMVQNAPITCDIFNHQICGIVGSKDNCHSLLNNIVAQLTTHHCYSEMKTIVVYDEQDRGRLGWMEKLPHAMDEDRKGLFVASSKASAEKLFRTFTDIMKTRKIEIDEEDSFGNTTFRLPYYLFVIAQPAYLNRNDPVTEYLFKNKDLNAGAILVVDNMMQLPKECSMIIEVEGNKGRMYHRENASVMQKFDIDQATAADFSAFSENLSHIICDEQVVKSTIPKRYSFFEMLKSKSADSLNLGTLWASADVTKSMAVPLGMGDGKEIFLDLHEKAHGPHGLVAGTTGSGKSELLQSYILSAAVHFHPHEIGFVIIDFKGGGMANQFAQLPHMLGTITNLDGSAIDRSLASINAELRKRERIFGENKVSDIYKYTEKYKAGQAKEPLPHLVIVVDEFAELKAEQPEFMKELISAARIGRSLGVHLILATQKPAGQVNEQIWSNSRFRLCLKVATREDSKEMLKSPLAYNIKEPGRAYIQVGNNEVFELFQSGYSGEKTTFEGETCTQLEAVVAHIRCYCEENGIKKLPDICLPALPEVIPLPSHAVSCENGVWVAVGRYDDPANQMQGEAIINLSSENVMIIGSPQTGKTNILQTVLRYGCEHYTSAQLNFYIVDFSSMILKNFEQSDFVGGVVLTNEDEKLENLFKMLVSEIGRRKDLFVSKGVSSYTAYMEAKFEPIPQIVLMIDNLTTMQELYPDESEILLLINREGISVGISCIVANAQTSGISFKYLMNFSKRIALYCNDSGEYYNLFDRNRLRLENIQGRALFGMDHQVLETQMFLSFVGDREIERVEAMQSFVAASNLNNSGLPAKKIPLVPDIVTMNMLEKEGYNTAIKHYCIPLGIDYSTMQLVHLEMLRGGVLAISGEEQSGKSNLVTHILNSLQQNIFDNLAKVYVADDGWKLQHVGTYNCVETFVDDAGEAKTMIESVYEELLRRREVWTPNIAEDTPMLIVVLSGQELISSLMQDNRTADKLMAMAKDLRKYKAFLLLSGVENGTINYSSPAILKYVKETHSVIVMENISDIRILDIPLKLQKEFAKDIRTGDGYSFVGGKTKKVHFILNQEE